MHKRVLNNSAQASASPASDNTHFGHYLKMERLNQGVSLEAISSQTKIKLEHLEALEEGDRRRLPADVFNRGFIRLYAETLHLDPQEGLDKYEKQWGFSNGISGAKTFLSGNHLFETTSPFLDRHVLIFLGIVFLVASSFLAYKIVLPQYDVLPMLQNLFQQTPNQTSAISPSANKGQPETDPLPEKALPDMAGEEILSPPKEEKKPIVPTTMLARPLSQGDLSTPNDAENDLPEGAETSIVLQTVIADSAASLIAEDESPIQETETTSAPTKPESTLLPAENQQLQYTLQAKFSETTWLRITLDDQEPTEYIFNPAESHTWEADTKIKLFLGNAGGVQLSLNDTPVIVKKKSGQTLKISFP